MRGACAAVLLAAACGCAAVAPMDVLPEQTCAKPGVVCVPPKNKKQPGPTDCDLDIVQGKVWGHKDRQGGTWEVTPFGDGMVFSPLPWMGKWFYLRLRASLPEFRRGLTYVFRFTGLYQRPPGSPDYVDFVRPPRLLLWRDKEHARYQGPDVGSGENYTARNPDRFLIAGEEFVETGGSGGATSYSLEWTATDTQRDTAESVWIGFQMLKQPSDKHMPLNWTFTNVCVERKAETRQPAPKPPRHATSRFAVGGAIPRPSDPPASDYQQSNCPWSAGGVKWQDQGFTPGGDVTLPDNTRVVVDGASASSGVHYGLVTVPSTSELIFRDEDVTLRALGFLVNGKFKVGSPTCRIRNSVRISLAGNDTAATHLGDWGTKGILADGPSASVDIHGKRFFPTWSRLSRTARAGDNTVYLQDGVNWEPGQEVVVVTTSWDDTGAQESTAYSDPGDLLAPRQSELMVVLSVSKDSATGEGVVRFTAELSYWHYGGEEYQAEVGLVSRQVEVVGEFADADYISSKRRPQGRPGVGGFGGFIAATNGAELRITGTALRYLGQLNKMGKHPVVFDDMGAAAASSYLKDSALYDSQFRAVVVRGGCNDLEIRENVAFRTVGHGIAFEDGAEENATVAYNLVAEVDVIGDPMNTETGGGAYEGAEHTQTGLQMDPTDSAASCFWFANAHNEIVGNAASGGWAGFNFPKLLLPMGTWAKPKDRQKTAPLDPSSRPFLNFEGNSAHSSGRFYSRAGCLFFSGTELYSGSKRLYKNGFSTRVTRVEGWYYDPVVKDWFSNFTKLWPVIKGTRTFLCEKGVVHHGNRLEVVGFESIDNALPLHIEGESWLDQGLVIGASGNVDAQFPGRRYIGVRGGEHDESIIYTNVEFRNFARMAPPDQRTSDDSQVNWFDNPVFRAEGYSSDSWHYEYNTGMKGFTFVNVPDDLRITTKIADNSDSYLANAVDWDGTLTNSPFGAGSGVIVGSHYNWWEICGICNYNTDWRVWLCPKESPGLPPLQIAKLDVRGVDIGTDNACPKAQSPNNFSNCFVGYTAQFGSDASGGHRIPLTENQGITGLTGVGWFLWFSKGPQKELEVQPVQVPGRAAFLLATNYPAGTTFTVMGRSKYKGGWDEVQVNSTSTREAVLAHPDGLLYHFDGVTLYLRPVVPNAIDDFGAFTRGGVDVYRMRAGGNEWRLVVEADCPSSGGRCSGSVPETIPSGGPGAACQTLTPSVSPTTAPSAPPSLAPNLPPTASPSASPYTQGTPSTAPVVAPVPPDVPGFQSYAHTMCDEAMATDICGHREPPCSSAGTLTECAAICKPPENGCTSFGWDEVRQWCRVSSSCSKGGASTNPAVPWTLYVEVPAEGTVHAGVMGAVVGAVVLVACGAAGAAAWWYRKQQRRRREDEEKRVAEVRRVVGDAGSLTAIDSTFDVEMTAPTSMSNASSPGRQWRLGRMIGKGSYGTVHEGLRMDGKIIAVKVLDVGSMDSGDALGELCKEIELMKAFDHTNIVQYLGAEHDPQRHVLFVLMEYVSGGSIATVVRKYGTLGQETARRYTQQIADGVAYLHDRGVIHRDIKGDNVLLSQEGCVKLADFGCSKQLDRAAQGTAAKTVVGTPRWMAPEIITTEGGKYGVKVDIWSVGCTVNEMLTGQPPWPDFSTAWATMYHIANSEPELPDDLPPAPTDFLAQCLMKDPDSRPTAAELREHRWLTSADEPFSCDMADVRGSLSKSLGATPQRSPSTRRSVVPTGRKTMGKTCSSDSPVSASPRSPNASSGSIGRVAAATAGRNSASQKVLLRSPPVRSLSVGVKKEDVATPMVSV